MRKRIWLGICEPQNGNISKVRNLMYRSVPRGVEMAFTVPLVCRAVESYWTKQFSMIRPAAILLNDDAALFGSYENYNVFLQCCKYIAKMPLENLFVINQHYEKQIYRDSEFEYYVPVKNWEVAMMRKQELRKMAEESIAAREAAREAEIQAERERDAEIVEELRCLISKT